MNPRLEILWENYPSEFRRTLAEVPGGVALISALIKALDPDKSHHWLDLCPCPEVVSAIIAKEFGLRVTSVVQDPRCEIRLEDAANDLGVSDLAIVIPAEKTKLPVSSEEYDRIFCIGNPFFPSSSPELADELLRVLKPEGLVGFAGPVSFQNDTPKHMEAGLSDFPGVRLRTPAWIALQYSKEGFHILTAEFIHGASDLWKEWLDAVPEGKIPLRFRNAIVDDGGRWLSLGLIILRKPPKPHWAV